ncbi:serine/threonine-protein kinase [Blastococcus sp. TF02A-26]|uniref:serine/threonine-protein kinase n=1 Tax=Blastococcus sp. TF02A-26 TaxID=2250577 RepID=UPI000DEB2573|nr:serine/threonine-protein kinase [Blastococcus sp. TF02A-26]RBY88673.1 serine/threonine protein kinase [Blastococcus sp. TF02A-26]
MALSTGTVLAGRYEITSPIATGGMGEVWRARDRVLDRVVAAKVLRSEFTGDPSFVARFRNEARHTAALSHPNIASVYDYGETEDERNPGQRLAFLVMELVEGQPLVTILHEEGRLPVDWTLHVLGQAADGLSAAHAAGVVHRDIKPGNLIVRPDGVVKLTDFGIARARDATPLTRTGMVVGTAQYLSPEQAQGFEVTAASDVYSLGVVGYECLTGSRPFDGTSQVAIALAHINRPPPPLPADVPLAVRQLLARSLEKHPEDRFDDGAAFAAAIRAVAAAVGSRAPAGTGMAAAAVATTQVVTMPAEPDEEPSTQVLDAAPVAAATGPRTSARPMPPLEGPPADEDPWDGETAAAPPPRRGRRWVWPVVALLVLALLLGLGWILFGGGDQERDGGGDRTSTSASTTATSGAVTGAFDPAALLGEDVAAATALLEGRGFTEVTAEEASNQQLADYGAELAPDGVAAVDPGTAGTLPVDTPITLYFAPDGYTPPAEESEEEGEDQPAPAPTSASVPRTSSAPSSSSPASSSSASPTSSAPATTSSSAPAPGSTLAPPPPEPSPVDPPAEAAAPGGAQGVTG